MLLISGDDELWLASAVRSLGLVWLQYCSSIINYYYCKCFRILQTNKMYEHVWRKIVVSNREKNGISFFGCICLVFGSVVSQDWEGEKIGNRPTHPGELVCPQKSISVQRMGRHKTTALHCSSERNQHRQRKWEGAFSSKSDMF